MERCKQPSGITGSVPLSLIIHPLHQCTGQKRPESETEPSVELSAGRVWRNEGEKLQICKPLVRGKAE